MKRPARHSQSRSPVARALERISSPGIAVVTILAVVVAMFIFLRLRDRHSTEPVQQPSSPSIVVKQPVRVIDGDTFAIGQENIRLFGIDAPEAKQICQKQGQNFGCGIVASRVLSQLIGSALPVCVRKSIDRYGRTVAVCTVNGKDLSREMIAGGWAVAFTRYSHEYVTEEAAARAAGLGIWKGSFEHPEVWRAQHR